MSDDTFNAGLQRTSELQREWDSLKEALTQVDRNDSDSPSRTQVIHDRMAIITAEMSVLLHDARSALPGITNTSARRQPQYSFHRRHIIERTYSSTSDSSEASFSSDEDADTITTAAATSADTSADVGDVELRRRLMHDAPHHTVITVENARRFRPQLAGLKRGLKDKVRAAVNVASGANASAVDSEASAPTTNTPSLELPNGYDDDDDLSYSAHDYPITPASVANHPPRDELRDALTLEHAKLERESQRLNRKSQRSREDEGRLEVITSRLSKLSNTLGKGVHPNAMAPATAPNLLPIDANDFDHRTDHSIRARRVSPGARQTPSDEVDIVKKQGPTSPVTVEESDLDGAEEVPAPATESEDGSVKKQGGRRKRGWQALEWKIRTIGRTVRMTAWHAAVGSGAVSGGGGNGAGGSSSGGHVDDTGSSTSGGRTSRWGGRERNSSASVFTEAGERLAERGERLEGVAEDSEQMATDAGDMLAAARALRQRNQSRGRVG